jgi:transcriptional regulator with XRE-family HTH domain
MYIYVFLCITMQMARESLAKDLENYRRRNGLTQSDLARLLRISQPHLSRLLSGGTRAGVKLRVRVEKLVAGDPQDTPPTEWSRIVAKVAARSPSFRKLVNTALQIFNER